MRESWSARKAREAPDLWGISQQMVPHVALETQPGDVAAFNHNLMHASFGGSTARRMFTINCCAYCHSEEEIEELEKFVAGSARFWQDHVHSEIMRSTASPSRMRHCSRRWNTRAIFRRWRPKRGLRWLSRPAGDTMPEKIKFGVVGCRVGRSWVAGARAGDDTVAWAVADLNQELARRVAHENDVPRVYGDYRELLADDEVDAVGIATAPDVRKPMVIDALNAGKHVLVQKPHGRSAADVREINAVAAECGKTLVYSYFMRHEEENKRSRHLIADGRIGRPYHARVHYHYRERGVDFEPPPGREWLYRWGLKGGALGQHGSHFLDQAWYLLGCPQPEWAFAASHSAFPTTLEVARHSEDYMSLMVGCAGDVTIQMDTSAVIPTWADRAWDLRLRVLGHSGDH